jgi:hypothetical protein
MNELGRNALDSVVVPAYLEQLRLKRDNLPSDIAQFRLGSDGCISSTEHIELELAVGLLGGADEPLKALDLAAESCEFIDGAGDDGVLFGSAGRGG